MRRDALSRLTALAAAVVLVAGVLAIGIFVAELASGSLGARAIVGAAVGIAFIVIAARAVPAPSLLGGYSAIVYACLFAPIRAPLWARSPPRYWSTWTAPARASPPI